MAAQRAQGWWLMNSPSRDFFAAYHSFLESKIQIAAEEGIASITAANINPSLYPHQRDATLWALHMGRALLAESFGMGKTRQQIEILRVIAEATGQPCLIATPPGARHVFTEEEGPALGVSIRYVKNNNEAHRADVPIHVTNYERIRSGDVTHHLYGGFSGDEGNYLRNLGSETTKQLMGGFATLPYLYIATATPSPNRTKELLHYAEFLGIMDYNQAVNRWFRRNPKKAHDIHLLADKKEEFWRWVATWALFLSSPADLGYDDTGYNLPSLNVHWHRVSADHTRAWEQTDRDGQRRLMLDGAIGIQEASAEKRATMPTRLDKMMDILGTAPNDHWLLWHHLEAERHAVEHLLPEAVTVFGTQDFDRKEQLLLGFERGEYQILATKPSVAGSGCNFQKHCHRAIFLGVDYSFDEFIQAIHRIQRYGQLHPVDIHIIFSESEESIVTALKRKWTEHDHLQDEMRSIIKEYGLSREALQNSLRRAIGVTRQETKADRYHIINNDTVLETASMPDNSVDVIVTSTPFSKQYEYGPFVNDFGHNESNDRFWAQMDFLSPELLRVLKPGHVAAFHCKDLAMVGKYSEAGIFNVYPFSDDLRVHMQKHGFIFVGRVTITTDVVKENKQTYRLGWTEKCKDASKMSVGMNEYIMLFRKKPTDTTTAYSDEPVVKSKQKYTKGKWQLDASGSWGSSGNRLLTPAEYAALEPKVAKRHWHQEQLESPHYDYARHVAIVEAMDNAGTLPSSFMLMPFTSKSNWHWSDIVYVRTLNTFQTQRREQNHVCPLPLDIVERCIESWSTEGDVVFDPFGGLMSVPYTAIKMGRYGLGIELNPEYYTIGQRYCHEAEVEALTPTLFEAMDVEVA